MKVREIIKNTKCGIYKMAAFCLIASFMTASGRAVYAVPETEAKENAEAADERTVIEIADEAELIAFAENCEFDRFSFDVTVKLTADIDFGGAKFSGIPSFHGIFDGNGHTISRFRIEEKGSDFGFFRYIGETGVVKELNLSGTIKPAGTRKNIGGIAGVNYGTLMDCSFEGNVEGETAVGAIAGSNKASGKIFSCSSRAVMLATNDTGGIVGKNEGTVSDCVSESSVNTEELETTLDIGGVDIGTLNLTQSVVNRNNMGGIAGSSSGMIKSCKNSGTVGFIHSGYNVGGIAGSQNGKLIDCENMGEVFGRKDVGGIVGQAEPYIESEYLEDKVEQTRDDLLKLNQTLSSISSSISSASAEAKRYTESLTGQYQASFDKISGNLDELSSAVSSDHPDAQGYVNNISQAVTDINEIGAAEEGMTKEQIDAVSDRLQIINDNLGSLQGVYQNTGDSAEALVDSISGELKKNDRQESIKSLADTVDNGITSVANGIESAVSQMDRIVNSVSADLTILTGEEDYITDISSIETAENTDGVIFGCVNRGSINGDLNVGGIVGTMNIEYDADPEFDLNLEATVNVVLRSTVNDVVIHSRNYGNVTVKKNCAGGIAGLQELGFLYDCEGYGTVKAETGNYLGGIVGRSAAAVSGSYSLCNIFGTDYVGGICGSGFTVTDNFSICAIESSGERIGGIAGMLGEEGNAKANYFVRDTCGGIDNISYAGAAEPVSYEEMALFETMPEGFSRVTVTFETEEKVFSKKTIAYGGSVSTEDFPEIPEKEGCYVVWPHEEALKDIRKNLTVRAEYVPWTESLASDEVTEDGKPLFLAEGKFYRDTELVLNRISGPVLSDKNAAAAYAYEWKLDGGKSEDSIIGHFSLPKTDGKTQLWLYTDGVWQLTEGREDGSYLTAELSEGTAFAVVTVKEDNAVWYIAGGAFALAAIVAFAVCIWRKKKKTVKKA